MLYCIQYVYIACFCYFYSIYCSFLQIFMHRDIVNPLNFFIFCVLPQILHQFNVFIEIILWSRIAVAHQTMPSLGNTHSANRSASSKEVKDYGTGVWKRFNEAVNNFPILRYSTFSAILPVIFTKIEIKNRFYDLKIISTPWIAIHSVVYCS